MLNILSKDALRFTLTVQKSNRVPLYIIYSVRIADVLGWLHGFWKISFRTANNSSRYRIFTACNYIIRSSLASLTSRINQLSSFCSQFYAVQYIESLDMLGLLKGWGLGSNKNHSHMPRWVPVYLHRLQVLVLKNRAKIFAHRGRRL